MPKYGSTPPPPPPSRSLCYAWGHHPPLLAFHQIWAHPPLPPINFNKLKVPISLMKAFLIFLVHLIRILNKKHFSQNFGEKLMPFPLGVDPICIPPTPITPLSSNKFWVVPLCVNVSSIDSTKQHVCFQWPTVKVNYYIIRWIGQLQCDPREGTPILGHGREVPRRWPPFLLFSIRLGPYFMPQHNLIDRPLYAEKICLSLSHLVPDTRT